MEFFASIHLGVNLFASERVCLRLLRIKNDLFANSWQSTCFYDNNSVQNRRTNRDENERISEDPLVNRMRLFRPK